MSRHVSMTKACIHNDVMSKLQHNESAYVYLIIKEVMCNTEG